MTHRPGQDERRILRGWRVGCLLLAHAPLAAALAACAESSHIPIGPGTGAADDAGVVSPTDVVLRCGNGAVACGAKNAGCCPAGQACVAGGCVPAGPCETNQDCSADSACGAGVCKPWSQFPAPQARDLSCRNAVDLPSLRPEVRCQWPGAAPPAEFPNSVQVIGTPMVVDFNYDNDPNTRLPSIVFVSYEGNLSTVNGVLRVISGKDCKLEASLSGDGFPFLPNVSPALGDIDGDGYPDIVAVDLDGNGIGATTGVAVYSSKAGGMKRFGLLARQTSSNHTSGIKGISIADVADDNDVPEILTNTGMFAFRAGFGIQEKINVEGSALEPPIAHDIDGDTIPEMVTSDGIFNWNSQTQNEESKKARNQDLWTRPQALDAAAFVGLANLGDKFTTTALGRDSAEMVIVSGNGLLVTQVDGTVLLRVQEKGVAGGPPVIADFDADGRMEFAVPGLDRITAYDLDCVSGDDGVFPDKQNCKNPNGPNPSGILWQQSTIGATSGASVFDFDGDQRAEVVYADQCFLRIMNGLDGKVLFSVPRSSLTRFDYPVIADVTGEGHSEIVTASNDTFDLTQCPPADPLNTRETVNFIPGHGVTVWEDKDRRWAGSRPIWNQHNYSVTNVNDDGTIPPIRTVPSQFTSPANDPNTLRENVQGTTGISLELADLTTWVDPVPDCQGTLSVARINVGVCNRGLLELPPGSANVALMRAGAPDPLCTRSNTGVLRSGTCEKLSCDLQVPDKSPGFNIVVLADLPNAVPECTEGKNNTATITNVFCSKVAQ